MRGVDLRLADSRHLRRLRRVLPPGILVSGAFLAPECIGCVPPVLAATFLLWRALAAVDPAGWRLAWCEAAGWTVGEAGSAYPVRLEVLGCFSSALWLSVLVDEASLPGAPRRRPVCVMADALEDGDWRRLRRRLRLDSAGASRSA